ncbi:MAG: twin-arginine translocase TatA/TatE family subunit [Planctomycetes bacterium]|jgi:sec-independent protein translocase protein TatA|nr:twin-arginine translocase TatA/TatE family subunit [Planctomycetota bacterium]
MLAFFLGHTEIIVILIIALLLFGTRLPKVARSLGQGIKEFKGGLRDVKGEVDKAGDEAPPKPE